jgi:hypothetical protein
MHTDIPDAVLQKQIGVVTELQDLVSESARSITPDKVEDSASMLHSAIAGLTMLDHCGEDPSPIFDAEALAEAIEAGVDRALDERGVEQADAPAA